MMSIDIWKMSRLILATKGMHRYLNQAQYVLKVARMLTFFVKWIYRMAFRAPAFMYTMVSAIS